MIWPTDAAKLAYTKLKTRKVRLAVTVIISSLLFGLLLGAAFSVRGAVDAIETLGKKGFGDRYILASSSATSSYEAMNDAEVIAKAEALQKDIETRKKAEAKRLGVEYDPRNDQKLVEEYDGPEGKQKNLNMNTPEAKKLVSEYVVGRPGGQADFEKLAKNSGASKTYRSVMFNGMGGETTFTILENGKENYAQAKQQTGPPDMNGLASISSQWQAMSKDLLLPFILPGESLTAGKDGSVPIIAPYSAAEKLAGLKPLPASAKPETRLERLAEVRRRSAGLTINLCYRNATAKAELQNALQQQADIARNKGNKDYTQPSLVYDKPNEACGPVRVVRDVRTADEKRQDAKQLEFRRTFGEPAPESYIQTLRIVGLNSDINFGGSFSVVSAIQGVVMSSLGQGWFSPLETAQASPGFAKMTGLGGPEESLLYQNNYMEVASATVARNIIEREACEPEYPKGSNFDPYFDPLQACKDKGKYFMLVPYGSSSLALDSFKQGFSKFFTVAALIIAAVAALILMGTVGRIIADSRRETAVFRAIGAKRSDISQIYLTYTLMVALLIIAASFIGGLLMASYLDSRYSDELTISAAVAFNVADLDTRFTMLTLPLRDIAVVSGCIILASLLAATLPLLSNVRRNPIQDMRDDR